MKKAFTLIEALIIVAVISILVGIFLPAIQEWKNFRKSSKNVEVSLEAGAEIIAAESNAIAISAAESNAIAQNKYFLKKAFEVEGVTVYVFCTIANANFVNAVLAISTNENTKFNIAYH